MKEGLRGENQQKKLSEELKYPVVKENEIILDVQTASPPSITWKIKNGSTVRTGEILAQYSYSTVAGGTKNGSSNNDASSTTSTATATNVNASVNNFMGIQDNNDNSNNNNGGSSTSNETSRKKIIRPRKRNRKAPLASLKSSSTTTNKGNNFSDGTVEMSDLLKSFGKRKNSSSSIGVASNDTGVSTTTGDGEEKKSNIVRSSSVSSSNSASNEKWTPIKSSMDGFAEIYKNVQRRILILSSSSSGGEDENDDKQKLNTKTSKRTSKSRVVFVLGKIEACQHPAVIDGLCGVCGQSVANLRMKTNIKVPISQCVPTYTSATTGAPPPTLSHKLTQSNNNNNGDKKRDAFTLSGGVTVSISQDYAKSLSNTTYESLRAARKLHLVLDLDHTLLHATADKRAFKWMGSNPDLHIVLLPMMEGHPMFAGGNSNSMNQWQPHYVKLRPHLAEFMSDVLEKYEITIYTAGTRTYANKIADVISRHVLDHQMRHKKYDGSTHVESKNETDPRCLDEGELNDLKQKVARLEERLRWDKSRIERQEYVERMNKQFESEKKAVDQKKIDDTVSGSSTQDKVKIKDGDAEMKKRDGNSKKRRRVCFDSDIIIKDETIGAKDEATKKLPSNPKQTKDKDELSKNQEFFEQLKTKLKAAEAREDKAQALRKKIFGSRIISRTDLPDLGREVKSLERVCPCGKMAAIVDDREDVWANAANNATGRKGEPPHNMLFVKPFHFTPFLNFADVNNASGKDLSEENNGQQGKIEDMQLHWTKNILRTVHNRFYDENISKAEQDKLTVPSILTQMRREVLSQNNQVTKVLLSGLVPLHLQNVDSSDEKVARHDVVRYVEELGGKVMTNVSNEITHVIAAKDGTDKILQARRVPGCAIVRIGWLMECYWSITRRDVEPHYLGPPPIAKKNINGNSSKKILLIESDGEEDDEDDDDDDDDDLMMEFKRKMDELQSKA